MLAGGLYFVSGGVIRVHLAGGGKDLFLRLGGRHLTAG